ncbi:MAG: AAA family ATPase, partial [Candidatus Obscuribacterales bacterium]|nr:AAA family ATPase [Candidatus Obscuribacterales bacterium]
MLVSTKDFQKEFKLLFQAKATLIIINTLEEQRAIEVAKQICGKFDFPCVSYDIADGFRVLSGDKDGQPQGAHDPLSALNNIENCKVKGLYILKDFHNCWGEAVIRRKLRNLAERLKGTDRSVVVITPVHEVPIELQDDSAIIDLPLPKAGDLDVELDDVSKRASFTVELDKLGRKKLLESGQGLTANQARRAFLKAAVSGNGRLDESKIEFISKAKQDAIRESQALEYYEVEETIEDVGGLENVKLWLKEREKNFGPDAIEYGLDVPKGIVLIGIPGTGKSLTAKTIASLWRMPLLRLDAGALFGKYIGESEENTRKALKLAGTLAPCVLWIDEVEKAFATGGGESDG